MNARTTWSSMQRSAAFRSICRFMNWVLFRKTGYWKAKRTGRAGASPGPGPGLQVPRVHRVRGLSRHAAEARRPAVEARRQVHPRADAAAGFEGEWLLSKPEHRR